MRNLGTLRAEKMFAEWKELFYFSFYISIAARRLKIGVSCSLFVLKPSTFVRKSDIVNAARVFKPLPVMNGTLCSLMKFPLSSSTFNLRARFSVE
jgi:hypothetical protein